MSGLFREIEATYYPSLDENCEIDTFNTIMESRKESKYEITYTDGSKKFVVVLVRYLDFGKPLKHLSWLRAIKTTAISTVKKVNGKWTYDTEVNSYVIDNDEAYIEDMTDKEFDDWCDEQADEAAYESYLESLESDTWSDYEYD